MMANEIIRTLISSCIQFALAGMIVLAARRLFGGMPPKLRYALWAAAFIKLLVPVSITSSASVFNLFNLSDESAALVNRTYGISFSDDSEAAGIVSIYGQNSIGASSSELDSLTATGNPIQWQAIALGIIACASVLFLFIMMHRYLSLKIQIYKWRRNDGAARLSFAQRLAGSIAGGQAEVVFSCAAHMPYVFGFFRPLIVLPSAVADESPEVLKTLVLHESVHILLGHHKMKFALALIQCLYWFNPFVHIFNSALDADMELECDARVLKLSGANGSPLVGREEYANVLVLAATKWRIRNWHDSLTAISAISGNGLKNRVLRILCEKKAPFFLYPVSALLVAALAASVFTSANPKPFQRPAIASEKAVSSAEPIPVHESQEAPQIIENPMPTGENRTETESLSMNGVTNVIIEVRGANVSFEKSAGNTSKASFMSPKSMNSYSLSSKLLDGGKTISYFLSPLTPFGSLTQYYQMIIYLPDRRYESLKLDLSAGAATIADFQVDEAQFNVAAGDLELRNLELDELVINASASSMNLAYPHIRKSFTSEFSASSFDIDFEALRFDFDMTVSASSGNISFLNPVDDARIELNGKVDYPDAWLSGDVAANAESELRAKIGSGYYKMKMDESSSVIEIKE
ncbi:MAG: DUF4097 family beta strand repeat-containing protein [Clostridiales bacterium]|jgi:beta-lactamase regulating signal transducer with metallopeptidase domain|nr:DUF4097 family beta strand repeat-containing protein [Clostridiales bacterium]